VGLAGDAGLGSSGRVDGVEPDKPPARGVDVEAGGTRQRGRVGESGERLALGEDAPQVQAHAPEDQQQEAKPQQPDGEEAAVVPTHGPLRYWSTRSENVAVRGNDPKVPRNGMAIAG